MFDKKYVLLTMCFFVFISISGVFAGDANQTDAVPGTYDDLVSDIESIQSGEVYNITRDYKFDSKGQTIILQDRMIEITQDNIVINGNGFKIDAGGSQNFAIFKVLASNVTINDLTFANSEPGAIPGPTIHDGYRYIKINSPICWKGDNGIMKNCTFYNNCAVNGGSMTWTGNNGAISNCKFINSTAEGAGGALYIGGVNNTVFNCVFIDSSSELSCEAVYVDRNRKNITVLKSFFTNELPVIDGSLFGIDVEYLFYSYKIPVWGNYSSSGAYKLDVIPLLYKSIMVGGVNNISDNFNYFAQYLNDTRDFVLNFAAYFEISESDYHLGFDYLKSMCFSNITEFNQVFDLVLHGKYEFSLTQNLVCFVHDTYDYALYSGIESSGHWFSTDKSAKTFITNLKVVFTDKIDVYSVRSWNPKKMGFNSIVIMGNGSTVYGGAKNDRDEKKWVQIDNKAMFMAYDLTVKNFNTAVECLAGGCYFNNVHFEGNRMDYRVDRDWGAAILNAGAVLCDNCSFTNNYAKNGGAIFNQGFLSLCNSTFKGNTAYGQKGDDVCVGDDGIVEVDGKNITDDTNSIYFAKSISLKDITLMTVVMGVGAFASGFLATVITCNPAVGMAIGAVIGGALGLFTASLVIESSYDVKFNRVLTCAGFVGLGAVLGALGGYVGSFAMNPTEKIILDLEKVEVFDENLLEYGVKPTSLRSGSFASHFSDNLYITEKISLPSQVPEHLSVVSHVSGG